MKIYIFIILTLMSNVIYSKECSNNFDCYANQKCENKICKDNNFSFFTQIKSQAQYINKEIKFYNGFDLGMSIFFSNENDWNKIKINTELLLNKYFSKLSFLKLAFFWDYEIYFFDIHPFFGVGENIIYDFNKRVYFSTDFSMGIVYVLSQISQNLKIGISNLFSIYFSIYDKDLSFIVSADIFLKFEF